MLTLQLGHLDFIRIRTSLELEGYFTVEYVSFNFQPKLLCDWRTCSLWIVW